MNFDDLPIMELLPVKSLYFGGAYCLRRSQQFFTDR
jgi:hypothetical protein